MAHERYNPRQLLLRELVLVHVDATDGKSSDIRLVQCLTETAASVGRASVPAEAGRDAGPTSRVPQLL